MRHGSVYDEIVKEIIPIYIDYDIKSFPLDLERICRLLSVSLIPYSECGPEAKELLLKKTEKGFFVRGTHENTPTIYYNDYKVTVGEMRYTISHEIKHYVYDECDDDKEDDDLADYFARFFLCPIPYLIVKGILSTNDMDSDVCYIKYKDSFGSEDIRSGYWQPQLFNWDMSFSKEVV